MKFLLLLIAASLAKGELAPLYESANGNSENRYVIVLEDSTDVDTFASRFQVDASLIGEQAFISKKLRYALKAVIADLNPTTLQLVRSLPGVEFVEEDVAGHIDETASWGTDRVNQRDPPLDGNDDMAPGNGSHIYILDTGIRITHKNFGDRATFDNDLVGNKYDDCHGHGTHCAGKAAGTKYGVAKRANVHAVRVCNCNGVCKSSNVVAGVDYVTSQKIAGVPNVVASMSLSVNANALAKAVNGSIEADVVVVSSSGNGEMDACNLIPGNIPEVITVGNTRKTDKIRPSSNYGTCVTILAPGTGIASAGIASDTSEAVKTGTSMACPHVAGAAGILMANRGVQPRDVLDTLVSEASTDKIDELRPGTPNKLLYVG